MLRTALLLFGSGVLIAGLVMFLLGKCAYPPFLIWGSIIVIAVLFERWRYQRELHGQERHWQPTGEKFEDPETGAIVEVQYDPASGERRYVKK
ncbi:hypothetical protein L4X63_03145 [Geomonas sp. Red32]|uniref:hypothetical protein n=1 Tax=Geomonas sp. Red32 TaxID=2912856 RepID=UPI00202CF90B|nr:hypothetical protein [Geomonas sp. Red32]MCM0080579.1 hypothetical protein [Geomonas sp. Red32]